MIRFFKETDWMQVVTRVFLVVTTRLLEKPEWLQLQVVTVYAKCGGETSDICLTAGNNSIV